MRRFWDKVDKRGPDECWPWTGKTIHGKGYGFASGFGKEFRAHRLAFFFANGYLPKAAPGVNYILHSCDNRLCCNPAHLRVGTQGDNIDDAVAKQRMWTQVWKGRIAEIAVPRAYEDVTP